MARVKINGTWFTKVSAIKEEVGRVFQILLSAISDWRPNLTGLSFERLDDLEVLGLEKPFYEEVFGALLGFNGDKALGPNGFSLAFWQSS